MARINVKKSVNRSPHSKKQQEVLKALESAARQTGLKVSAGQLRFAGLRLKGGNCFLRGRQWLILDKSQPFEDILNIYREALSLSTLVESGLSDEVLTLLAPYLSVGELAIRSEEQAA